MKTLLIIGFLGRILMFYAIVMTIPLLVAIYKAEPVRLAFLVSTLIALGAGSLMLKAGTVDSVAISIRECFTIVAGTWLLTSLIGSLPFWLSSSVPTYVDALFECVSGLSSTGATVVADIERLPDSILLWRSLTQWVGGLGIIILFLSFLPATGKSAASLFKAEFPGPKVDRVLPRIHDTAIALWLFYVVLTATLVLLLILAGMPLFDAVNHGFTTVATGGFSVKNASVAAYDSFAVELIITFFAFICGGNFALYLLAWKKGLFKIFHNTEFKVYTVMAVVSFAAVALTLTANGIGLTDGARMALFQVISIMTSTGFTTVDYDQWPSLAKTILFVLMFTGSCAGSTAAGIKIIRLVIVYKQMSGELTRLIHPNIVKSMVIDKNPVEHNVVSTTMLFLFSYITIYIISVILVSATGLSPFDSMAAVAATLGNVGPAFGVVGPAFTYADLSPAAKIILIADMLLGRLEIFPLLILLHPEFWQPYIKNSLGLSQKGSSW